MHRTYASQAAVVAGFVGLIASVPVIQTVAELRGGRRPGFVDVFWQLPSASNLRAYERRIEQSSVVGRHLRPWMQFCQFVCLGEAGSKAVVGREGWLFYRPGVEYLTARSPKPKGDDSVGNAVAAIVAYGDELAARGIRLLILPVPNKDSIYPEMLARRADGPGVVVGSDTRDLFRKLREQNVEVLDLFHLFQQAKQRQAGSPSSMLYLAQDSHWSPAGIELAAQYVADRVRPHLDVEKNEGSYQLESHSLRRAGDLLSMLQVPQLNRLCPPEEVGCLQVLERATGRPYRDHPESQVLVLGDSFLRIFEMDEPGSAGFAAHLAYHLGRPVASIVSDGGASTLVRQDLYRRSRLLANKRVVIWEFTERDVRFGTEGWQRVPLPPAAPRE